MTATALLLAVLVGGIAGFASGLLGIGGGIVMVPFLYALMSDAVRSGLAVPLEYQAAVAHATSLTVIIPTAMSGLVAFRRGRALDWRTIFTLGPTAALAALVGSRVAVALPTPTLKTLFGAVLLATGARIFAESPLGGGESGRSTLAWWVAAPAGALIGFLSALLGVGGGVVAIPILLGVARMDIRRVAPTSIGIMIFAAPAGVAGYVAAGWRLAEMPSWSAGFVFVPAVLAMIPGAILLAPLGARWNQRMAAGRLRKLFGVVLLVAGAELVWSNGVRALAGSG